MPLSKEIINQQVKYIRSESEKFLTDTCKIRRKTGETVIDGESIPVYAPDTTVACRLITRSGSENVNIASQERATKQSVFTGLYKLQLPFGTEITEGDLIIYTDIALNKERIFSAVFVPPFHHQMGAFVISIQEET